MKKVLFVTLAAIVTVAWALATTAGAATITCTGDPPGSVSSSSASVTHAISCTGTGVLGEADGTPPANDDYNAGNLTLLTYGSDWFAQDKDNGATAPLNGATEPVFTLTGGGGRSGSFTVSPSFSNCGGVTCTEFIVALKWDGLFAYFLLGTLLPPPATFDFIWSTTNFNLSHASLYGRVGDEPLNGEIPEPGSLVLIGTGLLFAARRFRHRSA
jgi:hypothetical protein